jgi:hypothetical protein
VKYHGKNRDGSLLSVNRLLFLHSNASLNPLCFLHLVIPSASVDCSDNFTGHLGGFLRAVRKVVAVKPLDANVELFRALSIKHSGFPPHNVLKSHLHPQIFRNPYRFIDEIWTNRCPRKMRDTMLMRCATSTETSFDVVQRTAVCMARSTRLWGNTSPISTKSRASQGVSGSTELRHELPVFRSSVPPKATTRCFDSALFRSSLLKHRGA